MSGLLDKVKEIYKEDVEVSLVDSTLRLTGPKAGEAHAELQQVINSYARKETPITFPDKPEFLESALGRKLEQFESQLKEQGYHVAFHYQKGILGKKIVVSSIGEEGAHRGLAFVQGLQFQERQVKLQLPDGLTVGNNTVRQWVSPLPTYVFAHPDGRVDLKAFTTEDIDQAVAKIQRALQTLAERPILTDVELPPLHMMFLLKAKRSWLDQVSKRCGVTVAFPSEQKDAGRLPGHARTTSYSSRPNEEKPPSIMRIRGARSAISAFREVLAELIRDHNFETVERLEIASRFLRPFRTRVEEQAQDLEDKGVFVYMTAEADRGSKGNKSIVSIGIVAPVEENMDTLKATFTGIKDRVKETVLRYDETRYQLLEQEMLHKKQPDGSKLIHKFQEVNDVFLYFDKANKQVVVTCFVDDLKDIEDKLREIAESRVEKRATKEVLVIRPPSRHAQLVFLLDLRRRRAPIGAPFFANFS